MDRSRTNTFGHVNQDPNGDPNYPPQMTSGSAYSPYHATNIDPNAPPLSRSGLECGSVMKEHGPHQHLQKGELITNAAAREEEVEGRHTGGSGGIKGFQGVQMDEGDEETSEQTRWHQVHVQFEDDRDITENIRKDRYSELRIPADFKPTIQSQQWVTMDTWTGSASKDRIEDRQQSDPRERGRFDFERTSNVDEETPAFISNRKRNSECYWDTPQMNRGTVQIMETSGKDVERYGDVLSRELRETPQLLTGTVQKERQSRDRMDRRAESVAERIARESKERGSRRDSCCMPRGDNHLSMDGEIPSESGYRVTTEGTGLSREGHTSKESNQWGATLMSDHTLNEDDVRKKMAYCGSDPDRLTTGNPSRMGQPRTVEKDTSVTEFWPSDGGRAVVDGNCRTGHSHPEQQQPANTGAYGNYFRRAEYTSEGILRGSKERESRRDICHLTPGSHHLSIERMMLDENSHRIAVDRACRNDGDASRPPFQRGAIPTFHPTSRKDAEWKDTTYRDSDADRLKTIRPTIQTCRYQIGDGDAQVEELWTPDGGRSIVSRGNLRRDDRPEQRDKDAIDAGVGNQGAFGSSSGEEIVDDSLTPSRHRRFPSTGRGPAASNKESCRANELRLVKRQRIQIDTHGVERHPADRRRVSVGDRYDERELLDVPMIGRVGSHSIEHRIPNQQIMRERLEDNYVYIHSSDDDTPNRTITRVNGHHRSPSFTRTDERYETSTIPRRRKETVRIPPRYDDPAWGDRRYPSRQDSAYRRPLICSDQHIERRGNSRDEWCLPNNVERVSSYGPGNGAPRLNTQYEGYYGVEDRGYQQRPTTSSQELSRGHLRGTLPRRDRKEWIRPEKFDGNASLNTFLAHFDNCITYNGWGDEDSLAHLRASLTGAAAQVLWDVGPGSHATYPLLVDKLRQRYGSAGQTERYRSELRSRRRSKNESLQALYQDIRRLMIMAYPGSMDERMEDLAKDFFIGALNDRDFEIHIKQREPKDLDAAFRLAERLEAYEKAAASKYDDRRGINNFEELSRTLRLKNYK